MKYYNPILRVLILFISVHFYVSASAQSEAAVKFFDEGKAHADKTENDLAIISFTEAIKLYPGYADAYNWRGYLYHRKKEYDIAIIDYKESIRLNPDFTNTHYNLAAAYVAKENFDMAIKEFLEAIRLDPNDKNNYVELGNIYTDQKRDMESAIRLYTDMIRLFPADRDGFLHRGYVYELQKEYDKAIEDYNQVIRLSPTFSWVYASRGRVYEKKKLFDLAIKDYNEILRGLPNVHIIYLRKAYAYKASGKTDLAIQSINEYVNLEMNKDAYIQRAWFYFDLKQYELALKDFAEAIRLEPKSVEGYLARGSFYRMTGRYDLAMTEYASILQTNPGERKVYIYRAYLQKVTGSYQLSIKDLETVLTLDPTYSSAYIDIISPLVRTGQFDKAKDYIKKYNKNPLSYLDEDEYKFYKYYLAVISDDLPEKNYGRALINLDKAIHDYATYSKENEDNKTEYIDILAMKGYVLEKLGRHQEAKEIYSQALVINNNQPDVKAALVALQKTTLTLAQSDKTPPVIQLISPQASRGLKIVSENTEIVGKAKDPAGIASVTINGKPVKTEEDGLFILNLPLKEGANDLLIVAVDKKGNKASKTFTLTGNIVAKREEPEVIVPIATDNKILQYHAILIAAKDYADPSISDLDNPVKDATELKNILIDNYSFNEENVETLYNKNREEIMQAIVLKSNMLTENDNLLIFYAGHGIGEKDKFGDVDGYWIPSSAKKGLNASYISSDDINKALKRSNAKHILVIADACFSGAFTRELPSDASVGVQKQYSVPSRKIMASGNMEPVPDNSRFIYYLKKNLKENKEKYLTAKKLFDGFYEAILNNSDTSPQYAAIKNVGDEGGEFVFIKK